MRRKVLPDLEVFLRSGGRGIQAWLGQLPVATARFMDAAVIACHMEALGARQSTLGISMQQRRMP
jgi:hypothetical protein